MVPAGAIELDHEAYANQTVEITDYTNETHSAVSYFPKDGVLNMSEGFQTLANLGETSGPDYFLSADVSMGTGLVPPTPSANWPSGIDPERLSTLGYATSRYIGLNLDTATYDDNDFIHIANVYNNVPDEALHDSVVSAFNPASTMYYDISEPFLLTEDTSAINIFKGDCFLQRVYFRGHFSWDMGVQFSQYDDNTTGYGVANYGFLVSTIIESKYNNAMRNEVEVRDTNLNLEYTYYPKIASKNIALISFLVNWRDEQFRYEAFYINKGYNKVLSHNFTFGADMTVPEAVQRRFTRIYFSNKSHAGEIKDNFRNISVLSFRDYPLEKGEIVSLQELGNTLVSIQENAINQHFLGQQELVNNPAGQIVTEQSGLFLSPQVKPLASFGSTSQWSVFKANNTIFGVDYKRRIIWMVGASPNDQGVISFGATNISYKTQIEGWINDLLDGYDINNDIIDRLTDNPVNGFGVVTGYNPRYKEMNFTFHLPVYTNFVYSGPDYDISLAYITHSIVEYNSCFFSAIQDVPVGEVPPACGTVSPFWSAVFFETAKTLEESFYILAGDLVKVFNIHGSGKYYISPVDRPISESDLIRPSLENSLDVVYDIDRSQSGTIVFDNSIMSFVGTQHYKPSMYFNLGLHMFSSNIRGSVEDRKFIYLHDVKTCEIGNFYGTKYDSKLSFIVNGADARDVVKVFNNYIIESNEEPFAAIEFYTDYQQSDITPFVPTDLNLFYIKPEYLENMWYGPIPSNKLNSSQYNVQSEMRGTWLKIVLTYNGDNEQFVRKFILDFIQSFI